MQKLHEGISKYHTQSKLHLPSCRRGQAGETKQKPTRRSCTKKRRVHHCHCRFAAGVGEPVMAGSLKGENSLDTRSRSPSHVSTAGLTSK